MISALRYLACCGAFSVSVLAQQIHFGNSAIEVTLNGEDNSFWTLSSHSSRQVYTFSAPVFEIDGIRYPAALTRIRAQSDPVRIASEIAEYRFEGTFRQDPSLKLELIFRVASNSPVSGSAMFFIAPSLGR